MPAARCDFGVLTVVGLAPPPGALINFLSDPNLHSLSNASIRQFSTHLTSFSTSCIECETELSIGLLRFSDAERDDSRRFIRAGCAFFGCAGGVIEAVHSIYSPSHSRSSLMIDHEKIGLFRSRQRLEVLCHYWRHSRNSGHEAFALPLRTMMENSQVSSDSRGWTFSSVLKPFRSNSLTPAGVDPV